MIPACASQATPSMFIKLYDDGDDQFPNELVLVVELVRSQLLKVSSEQNAFSELTFRIFFTVNLLAECPPQPLAAVASPALGLAVQVALVTLDFFCLFTHVLVKVRTFCTVSRAWLLGSAGFDVMVRCRRRFGIHGCCPWRCDALRHTRHYWG